MQEGAPRHDTTSAAVGPGTALQSRHLYRIVYSTRYSFAFTPGRNVV